MFVASLSANTVVPPPVSPPSDRISEIITDDQHALGICEICREEGPSETLCTYCGCPSVLYKIHYCGLCMVCGDYGCTGLLCLECGEDTGAVYGDPLFPRDVVDTPKIIRQSPKSTIASMLR
jgi:hypothetical protein